MARLALLAVMTVSMLAAVFAAESRMAYASSWDTYRGNDENNAVVSFETPVSRD